jgi:hypothetical protein
VGRRMADMCSLVDMSDNFLQSAHGRRTNGVNKLSGVLRKRRSIRDAEYRYFFTSRTIS